MSRGGNSLFALLVRAHARAHAIATDMLFERGVSVLEAWLLEEIPAHGTRCASELAESLDVPVSTVTRALRRLESYGYITLTKGIFRDARVLRPQLTALGDSMQKHTTGFEKDLDRLLLHDLRPIELGAFARALTRITMRPRGFADQPLPPGTHRFDPQVEFGDDAAAEMMQPLTKAEDGGSPTRDDDRAAGHGFPTADPAADDDIFLR